MTITNGYATLEDYRSYMTMRGGTTAQDAADDAVLEVLIEGTSRFFDRETGRRFFADSSDQTRYYTADNAYYLEIDPLSAAPTSLSVDYTGLRSYTALTSGTDFDLLPDNAALEGDPYTAVRIIKMISSNYFPTFDKGVKIVGKFGYPSVPGDVKDAVLMIVQNVNSQRSGQSGSGRVTVTAAGVAIQPEEVPDMAWRTIMHYRNRT